MSKEFLAARKVSAIVALALAAIVTFAALNSYGDPKAEDYIVYDVEASIERAYEDVIDEEEFAFEAIETEMEYIKVFNADNELVKTISVQEGGFIENEKDQQLLNRADFMSAYHNTQIYKINK